MLRNWLPRRHTLSLTHSLSLISHFLVIVHDCIAVLLLIPKTTFRRSLEAPWKASRVEVVENRRSSSCLVSWIFTPSHIPG